LTTAGNVQYPVSGCDYQCFGKTQVDQASALASNGLPKAGTPAAPVRAMIQDNPGNDGFRFSNGVADARLKLDDTRKMVLLDVSCIEVMKTGCHNNGSTAPISGCAAQAGSTAAYLTGTGYLDATTTSVAACGTAQANTIQLFPTQFAHDGVIRISLDRATASCSVTKPGPGVASAAYQATLSYWNGSTYIAVATLSSTNTTDPLASVNLGLSVGSGLTLGDYVRAWKSTTAAEVTSRTITSAKSAQAAIPSAVSITSQPTRAGDPTSVVSVDLGAVSCQAGDRR
jgi:hypothetical protein